MSNNACDSPLVSWSRLSEWILMHHAPRHTRSTSEEFANDDLFLGRAGRLPVADCDAAAFEHFYVGNRWELNGAAILRTGETDASGPAVSEPSRTAYLS